MGYGRTIKTSVSKPELVKRRRIEIIDAAVSLFSGQGYYRTKISDIAERLGVSQGTIYKYFEEKDDILYLAIMHILETYEKEIPGQIQSARNPVEKVCLAIRAYCQIVDRMPDETVLAYRSTKSLHPRRQEYIKEAELKTNSLIEECVTACVEQGFYVAVNDYLLSYQYVMYCHTWALKNWALRQNFDIEAYIKEGCKLLVEPFLTKKGWESYKSTVSGNACGLQE